MADILDIVFLFWVFLTSAVYILGIIYDKHSESIKSSDSKKKHYPRGSNAPIDAWSSPYNSSSVYQTLSDSTSNTYNAHQQHSAFSSNTNQLYSSNNRAQSTSYRDNETQSIYQQEKLSSPSDWQRKPQYQSSYEETPVKSASHEYNHNPLASGQTLERSWSQHYSYNESPNHRLNDTLGDNSIPTASGFNSDCVEWVNSILLLFYSQSDKYGPIIMESLYRSLNEKLANILSTSDEYGHLIIEFVGFNHQLSTRPELTNIRTENESEKSVSAVCKIYNRRIIFDLSIQQAKGSGVSRNLAGMVDAHDESQEGVHYELTLENLEGKLKSVAMRNDKLIIVQFMEKPDTKILLRRKYSNSGSMFGAPNIINEDSLVNLVLRTLTQIVVDLYFGDDADFPHYVKHMPSVSGYRNKLNIFKGSASEIKRQIKHDFFGSLSSSADKERKIFIKIINAKNINYNQNVTCLLELDTPYQQALSSTKQGSNPHWEEHFLFNMGDKSTELSIELWDSACLPKDTSAISKPTSAKSLGADGEHQVSNKKWSKQEVTAGAKFLGLAKVNIDDLRRNPVQKVNLMLQSRKVDSPNEQTAPNPLTDLSNSVGGELQVELMFMEHSTTGSGAGLQKSNSLSSISYQLGDVVSVDRKLTPSGYVITTTTITKPKDKLKRQNSTRLDRLSVRNQPSPVSSIENSEFDTNLDAVSSQIGDIRSVSPGGEFDQQNRQQQQADGRSHRSRSRSRSFLRAIKKRFSLSRTRSRSMGESSPVHGRRGSQSALGTTNLETGSIDSRSRASSEVSMGRAKSMPRDLSEVPTIVINKSRLSDTASAFTFTHPRSQLVIECKEPGSLSANGGNSQRSQLKYYAIPDELAHKSKWRRKGIKLHIFNEHQFMACHLAGSSTCHLCGRVFSRRPGKQGYKCRNCHLLSHKQCHVKVDHNCPYAAMIDIEYIDANPPARLIEMAQQGGAEIRQSSDSLPGQQQNRPSKIGTKSISMEVDDR